ncbi:hypothetical protein MKK64_10035 [Methylobacterium sp. E-025]|uniref:hypothetical protein n=1 Tax=unclassified Methylobacterium TaxID=2615210 RepID=UPI0011C7E02A|nr:MULTISPECIES: hypothetical protein [unclassified Methylobacterium]MCJ2075680.1 hypothetical protein [Methylobacterium sp. E-016]MCJ2111533.1 hypothetical protein [Methylobacterium sp. E-025]TXN58083.1 hypothetical protein FV230_27670 [Methylobacterium sp. WL6]
MTAAGQPALLAPPADASARRPASERFGLAYRIGLPIALWVLFANGATHYRDRHIVPAAGLREAVEAEVASRLCPGLRLDEASFRIHAQAHGINHSDLYQKRSAWLRKDADALERELRADPDTGCRHMLDLYGGDGTAPHLLTHG